VSEQEEPPKIDLQTVPLNGAIFDCPCPGCNDTIHIEAYIDATNRLRVSITQR
jgi:hypothetical protein